ncbi:hypothetical protein [Nocardia sp. NPDC057455]|uniref:hypothetical protein n=1 Tax=Nocardia sp. NPDC057455 TaxID=3346138 RepID=UPI0036706F73
MNAEEIRTEAIGRIAAAIRAEHWCTDLADAFGGYECCCGESWGYPTFDGCQTRHNAARTAERYVDALGDMLPTEERWKAFGAFGDAPGWWPDRDSASASWDRLQVRAADRCGASGEPWVYEKPVLKRQYVTDWKEPKK